MARLQAVTGIFIFALIHVTMSITVQEFFPDIKSNNLTKIKWSHATNSQAALKKALNSTNVHMIEADVVIGTVKGSIETNIPIMAHPPAMDSDLSLADFLTQVIANKTKGIKLDFKTIEAFNKSLEVLNKTTNLTHVPVWLNADILAGPGKSNTTAVNHTDFLKGAEKLPFALLSVGWTTNVTFGKNTTENYTIDQIDEMAKLIKGKNQSVTYPVRACYAANDVTGFAKLLNETKANNATLTIWSSEGDVVNATLLSAVIKRIGLDKVYLDVPASLESKLNLSGSASASQISLVLMIATIITSVFSHLRL